MLSRAEARQQLGLKEGDVVIGTIDRLVAKKRHEVLIKGFAELANQRLKLLIVGEGPRRKELQELAEKLGVEQQVVFAGFHARANRLVKPIIVTYKGTGLGKEHHRGILPDLPPSPSPPGLEGRGVVR